MNIDVDTGRRGLVMTMIIIRGMAMMFLVVPVFYAAGGEYPGHEQEHECSEQALYIIFHNNNFILRDNGKTLPVLKVVEIRRFERLKPEKCRALNRKGVPPLKNELVGPAKALNL